MYIVVFYKLKTDRRIMSLPPPRPEGDVVFWFRCLHRVCVVVCVISCEHDNFRGVLNFIFKLEPNIDHIKVSDEFENW